MRIDRVESFAIDPSHAPSDFAWGNVAAVSYRGSDIVDATLVPIGPEDEVGYAWVAADAVDRIQLVGPEGEVVATTEYAAETIEAISDRPRPAGFDGPGSAGRRAVRIVARLGNEEVPTTPRMRELMDRALSRVPDALLLLAPSVVLLLDRESARSLSSEPDVVVAAEQPPPEALSTSHRGPPRVAWHPRRQELLVELNSTALAEYERSRLALTADVVRALADVYVRLTAVHADHTIGIGAIFGAKLPSAFPEHLRSYLSNQYASLLASGESVVSAWHGLHQIAVTARLARPYVESLGPPPQSHEDAVAGGFASMDGALGPAADLAEYATYSAAAELWKWGPCPALRGTPLDALAPPLLVHAAKLIALQGLGLIAPSALQACVDMLRISETSDSKHRAGAIVLHKSDGERITFTDELEGIRQPYFSNEVQLSWKAQRAYLSASLSVGYRGSRPAVMRLQAIAGHESRDFRTGVDHGAVLAFANPDGYRTTVAEAGLLVVTDVRKDALNAYALMVSLREPIAGTKVLPLVSAQVAEPVWGAAP